MECRGPRALQKVQGAIAGVRAGFHLDAPYCSERCRTGNFQIVCRKCKKPATLAGDWRHCGACGQLPLKRDRSLTIANNVWRYDLAPKEGGDDAKRRKRA